MLLLTAVAVTFATSSEAQTAVRQLFPIVKMPAFPLLLVLLATMCAFTALVLSSRSFALLALAAGLGSFWLEPGFWRPLTRWVYRLPENSGLSFDRMLEGVLHGSNSALGLPLSGELFWLLPLAGCALLLAGVLTMGTKVE
jgi:hypothetical protein